MLNRFRVGSTAIYRRLTDARPAGWLSGVELFYDDQGEPVIDTFVTYAQRAKVVQGATADFDKIAAQRAFAPARYSVVSGGKVVSWASANKGTEAMLDPSLNKYERVFQRAIRFVALAAVWSVSANFLFQNSTFLGMGSGMSAIFIAAAAALVTAYLVRGMTISHMVARHQAKWIARRAYDRKMHNPQPEAKHSFLVRVKNNVRSAFSAGWSWLKSNWLRSAILLAVPVAFVIVVNVAPTATLGGALQKALIAFTTTAVFTSALWALTMYNRAAGKDVSTWPANDGLGQHDLALNDRRHIFAAAARFVADPAREAYYSTKDAVKSLRRSSSPEPQVPYQPVPPARFVAAPGAHPQHEGEGSPVEGASSSLQP